MGIRNRDEYHEYLTADKQVNGIKSFKDEFHYTWRYIKALRRYEYYVNTKSGGVLGRVIAKIRMRRWGLKTGISIGINSFGKGLYLPHYGSIVVNSSARFGDYCIVQSDVNVSGNVSGGDHIYLAAGAKVLKDVRIPNYCIVAANAVLNEDIEEENVVVGGIPAKIISRNGMKDRTSV